MTELDTNNPSKINGYDVIDNTLIVPQNNYYQDTYTLGQTKEQINIGLEVKEPKYKKGDIQTTDLTSIDKTYTLAFASSPDGAIWSIGINGNEKTFKVGFYGNDTLAMTEIASEIQTWLGEMYIVEYSSGYVINISRRDGATITKTTPNLVRKITLSSFDTHSLIDVTVDGVTVVLDGATHSGNPNTAITYLKSQLSSTTYFMDDDGADLIIARKDADVPVISKTQYNRYTYNIRGWSSTINPTSINLGGSAGSTECKEYKIYVGVDGNNTSYTLSSGLTFTATSVSIPFSNVPTLPPSQTDSNGNHHGTKALDMLYSLIGTGYTKGSISSPTSSGSDFWDSNFDVYKDDYSSITFTESIDYVIDSSLTVVNVANESFTATQTNHLADETTSTYTEISITQSSTGNNYFLEVGFNPKKIQIIAKGSGGESFGTWENQVQSCNTRYSTTTAIVPDKIFKTDASNYGNVVYIKRGGVVFNTTTTASVKLSYICE